MNATTIRRRLKKYFAQTKHPIQFAYLFGSVARGQTLPFSDVDVAVYLDERANGNRYKLLAPVLHEVIDTLGTDQVDLLCLNTAPPDLAFSVLEHGQRLYSRDEKVRALAETRMLQRYYDESPADNQYYRFLQARILAGKMIERTPEMIDAQSVQKRLDYMANMLIRLDRFRRMPRDRFLEDEDAQEMADHELHTSIEAMADICSHIVAALGLGKPPERRDAPMFLSRAGILPHDLAKQLSDAIEMRNQLVHGYIDVDHQQVYDSISNDLRYFQDFAEHITRYIQKIEQRETKRGKKK